MKRQTIIELREDVGKSLKIGNLGGKLGSFLGSYWVWFGFGLGSDWVRIFCVFLDSWHCKFLS